MICQALNHLLEVVLDELIFAQPYHRNQLDSFEDDVSGVADFAGRRRCSSIPWRPNLARRCS